MSNRAGGAVARSAGARVGPARVGLLSHRGGNIGHDFMALGVEVAARAAFADRGVEIFHLEQHRPFDIYPPASPWRVLSRLPHGRLQSVKRLLNRPDVSERLWRRADPRIAELDVALVCGGPAIVPRVHEAPEMGLMFHHQIGGVHAAGVPVLNLSLGSCYPWEKVPTAFASAEEGDFHRRAMSYCHVTTVRDPLAQELFRGLEQECPLIPCPASLMGADPVSPFEDVDPTGDGLVVINFQEHGANEDWGQKVSTSEWRSTMRALIDRMQGRHRLAFVCHNAKEVRLAAELAPELPCHFPRTVEAYAAIANQAIAGVCNRLHAGIALASIGVPAIFVGTDTRLKTAQMLGLPAFFVKEVDADLLEATLERQLANRRVERDRLLTLRAETLERYAELIRAAADGRP